MNTQTAIGIIDAYTQLNLDQCLNSIPEEFKQNLLVVSNTNNKIPSEINYIKYKKETSFASLRNRCLSTFRKDTNIENYFLINSNTAITDKEVFSNILKTSNVFGTQIILGPGSNSFPIEDDTHNITLEISPELNSNFIFINSNVIDKIGFLNEFYFNNDSFDILDFIIRARKAGLYPPNHFNPIINKGIYISKDPVCKISTTKSEKLDHLTYGMFLHTHKYIPGHQDPPGETQDNMLKSLEQIQKNYAKSF
jgi:hypothetical protein